MIVGTEWLIDASGCEAATLRDTRALSRVFDRIVAELNLQTLGEATWHQFPPPGGITGFLMLTESHLACHTYPEFRAVTINLYCCRERPEWPWAERLREMLGADRVNVSTRQRTIPDEQDSEDHLRIPQHIAKGSLDEHARG